MKNSVLTICHESIYPGEQLSLALTLPALFSCAPLYMPIKVIHGHTSGPVLLITAAMHGDELNGTEIINRLMSGISPKRLNGTLIAVPVLNVYGLIHRSPYMPGGVDLDTCFPGSRDGTHAARVANIFISEVFNHADYCIDLRTEFINYTNFPQMYVDFGDAKSKELAQVFNTPVILNAPEKAGSLHAFAKEAKKPFLIYEAGEAMRFDEHAIKAGLTGIYNVMRKLQMLAEKPKKTKMQTSQFTHQSVWIHASASGISHVKLKLGKYVKKHEELCVIKDPFGANENVVIRAPEEGIVIGKNNLPLVQEGDKLFQLAVFPEMNKAVDYFESWEANSTMASE